MVIFGEMSSGVMNQKYNCLDIMTIVMFGGKGGGLQAEEHHPNREARVWQHHDVGMLCCRGAWCTSQNRWHHEDRRLCGYIEATSQDISQEVKAWSQMGLPNGQ